MAQAPTLYQFDIELNHADRGISETLSVRTAKHPSETMQRVWLRLLAFAWHFCERIGFGPGLSEPEAPDILAVDLTGETKLWVRVGKATDPAKIQRVVDQHPWATVAIFFASTEAMETFVNKAHEDKLSRLSRVELASVDNRLIEALAATDERRTRASITIAGDHFYIDRGSATLDGAVTRGSW